MKSENPYQGPVRVRLEFVGARANADSDNLAKAVLDGMNKIVYLDDHQVISLHVERFPAGDPYGPQRKGVDIGVEEVA
jgi:Holliday junction resolvase RusA-like endonuclease